MVKDKYTMISKLSNQITYNNKQENKEDKQSFKGGLTPVVTGLRGLSNSPALGACAVDVCSMVTPRTVIEMKNRGPQAGFEALFREGSSCLLHACLGLIGLGAATAVSGKFNEKYGVKAQNIFASSTTINNMSSLWDKAGGQKDKFFEGFLNNIKGLNGTKWQEISQEAKSGLVQNLVKLSDKAGEMATKTGAEKKNLSKEVKVLKDIVTSQIIKDTGAQTSFKLNAVKDEAGKVIHKGISSSLSELTDNAVTLSNTFSSTAKENLPSFLKALKGNKTVSTILGLSICAALCMSVQPFNRYLTKKRTGQDGFVGVENREPDNSKGFKAAKTAMGIAFPIFAASTIGKPSELLANVQFNSKIPSLNHFKLIYGLTIGSRFMSARDKNELRESAIKDTLGYTNWLILGGMVSKLTARALGGKDLINNPVAHENGKKGIKYAAKWLTQASVKSYDEILLPKAKEFAKNGKMMKFSEILKNADRATKSKVYKAAGAQIAGYLYSGLVLGIGISKLNIFITRRVQAKRDAKKQMNEQVAKIDKIDTNYVMKTQQQSSTVFKDFK